MKCLNCNSAANSPDALCTACGMMYRIGMMGADVIKLVDEYRSDSYKNSPIPDENSKEKAPIISNTEVGGTAPNSQDSRHIISEPLGGTDPSPLKSDASISTAPETQNPVSKVKTLFPDTELIDSISKASTTEEAFELAKGKVNIRTLFTLQQHYQSHPVPAVISDLTQAVHRDKDTQEIADEQRILSGEEIARISLAREQSLNKMVAMIRQQGEYNGMSVYDRTEEQYSVHLHGIQKKIAELRLLETVAKRSRKEWRENETNKLSPEEREAFNHRAKKVKNPSKAMKLAKQDAAKGYSKDMKLAIKSLDVFGASSVKLCVKLYGVSEQDCLDYLAGTAD